MEYVDQKEVSLALSLLKKNGLHLNLPESLSHGIDQERLFDGDDVLFKREIATCSCYGEYGSGKSTLWVARNFPQIQICSVDSSQVWVNQIREEIGQGQLDIKYVDVGPVKDWGKPLGLSKRQTFKEYAEILWQEKSPDLVLIDGRFRVLCFLTTLAKAQEGTTILFDDYIDRPQYHVAEEYCHVIDRCGRQVMFQVPEKSQIDYERLGYDLPRFEYVTW